MPSTLEQRKERLFAQLTAVYDDLSRYSDLQRNTDYGCRRSGRCCQVGLELHWMECENISRHLKVEFEREPNMRPKRVRALKRALTDKAWTASAGFGDLMCGFFDHGCTVYPFRPGVCRMYGPLLPVDDECPRERLGGRPFVYFGDDVDDVVRRFYRVLDDYGRLTGRDRSIYMPTGVLTFLLPKQELTRLRAATPSRFWRSSAGYRTQFKPQRNRIFELRRLEREEAAKPESPFRFLEPALACAR